MFWTGLMGGGAFVNIVYMIRKSKRLPLHYKELGVMVTTVFDGVGIFLATLFSLLLENTQFKDIKD
jgi:hypothetical protein